MKNCPYKISLNRENPIILQELYKSKIFNFVNLNTLWWIRHNHFYLKTISQKGNLFFPDSRIISILKGLKQQRGPTFSKNTLFSDYAKSKKHFFIGLDKLDIIKLSEITKLPIKKLASYNPPYIKDIVFSLKDVDQITNLLIKFKPNFIWVCVGSPKQELLANQLYKKYKSTYLNIGAAIDFLLCKKKEAPKVFQKVGLEWFYRLITDFRYSKKKVWRSFLGLFYFLKKDCLN
jgi:exopolysaccharide biosynthesis WecB/TagA/CpsF family protein